MDRQDAGTDEPSEIDDDDPDVIAGMERLRMLREFEGDIRSI